MDACESEGLYQKFIKNNGILEKIQKELEEYLETKRAAFPRFYFLSNDDLIEILSQTRNPHAVQPHLNKCFDAIKSIKFTNARNSTEITHMISAEDEVVPFHKSVFAEGNVEHWMTNIEKMMCKSLYEL